MPEQITKEQQGFAHCVRLRGLALQQTLTLDDRRDLDAIADLLHALLAEKRESRRKAVQRGESEVLALIVLRNIASGYWNAGRDEPISAKEYAHRAVSIIDGLHPGDIPPLSQESPNT